MRYHEKLDYLAREVESSIATVDGKTKRNRRWASVVSISSSMLGAAVTIALGLQIDSLESFLKNLALVFGSLIAVVNAFESFFRYRSQWIRHTVTLLQLLDLKDRIDFLKVGVEEGDEISEHEVESLFRDYRRIWEAVSDEWMRLLREEQEVREEQGGERGGSV